MGGGIDTDHVDDKLIINPGAPDASLAALDRKTGKVLWKSAGKPHAYASFVLHGEGASRQIIGYDRESLGGWDPTTGKRRWTITPITPKDFNVPTPIVAGNDLLVSTENNGTRRYVMKAGVPR